MASTTPAVVLIAGISGGIGQHVALAAEAVGLQALPLPQWLEDGGEGSSQGAAVVGVVNCAGKGMSAVSDESYDELVAANVEVTRTCIRVAQMKGVPLVHLGSAMETSDGRTGPYVLTKRMASELVHEARANPIGGLRAVQLSLHNVYGPLVKGFVADMVKQHLLGQPAQLRQPTAVRDFVYVSDVAEAVLGALGLGDHPVPIPIGTGVGTSVADVAEIVSKLSGVRPPWTSATTVKDQEMAFGLIADTEMATRVLAWLATVDLHQGAGAVFNSMARGN